MRETELHQAPCWMNGFENMEQDYAGRQAEDWD